MRESLFIEWTTPLASTNQNTRKPARLTINPLLTDCFSSDRDHPSRTCCFYCVCLLLQSTYLPVWTSLPNRALNYYILLQDITTQECTLGRHWHHYAVRTFPKSPRCRIPKRREKPSDLTLKRQLRAETMRKEVTRPNYRVPEPFDVHYCRNYSRSPQKIIRKDIIPGKAGASLLKIQE